MLKNEILNGCNTTSIDYIIENEGKKTAAEIAEHLRLEGCPHSWGDTIANHCETDCKNCKVLAIEEYYRQAGKKYADIKTKITVEFHLQGKATTALIKKDGKVAQKGIAKQHVDDKYDANIGMMWALAKALDVQPTDMLDMQEILNNMGTDELVKALHSRWCE